MGNQDLTLAQEEQRPYTDWQEWLSVFFPYVTFAPFAQRHIDFWEWIDSIELSSSFDPRLEIWARGGAKSSTAELGVTWLGEKLARRFILYVCGTQDQSDNHVLSIASLFEQRGIDRRVNKYGQASGWSRQQLRTATGFNVAGIGLDKAMRGIKVEQYRPDFIIFDDIDNREDTLATVDKKIRAITHKILPAGSNNYIALFIQNLIHEQSILSRLYEGTANFCHNREIGTFEPAVYGLEWKLEPLPDGKNVYKITAGRPSWEGQDLTVCEKQMNEWGEQAFQEEAQHNVSGAKGYVFDVAQLRSVKWEDCPPLVSLVLAGDLAATEGGGDHTVYFLLGKAKNNTFYILAVIRGQWSPDRVQGCLKVALNHYKRLYPKLQLVLPQDPGAAGKILAYNQRTEYGSSEQLETGHWKTSGPIITPVTGSKATRAAGFAKEVNRANVFLVEQDIPDVFRDFIGTDGRRKPLMQDLSWQTWHRNFKAELKSFREDELDQIDDQVDAGSDGYNHLARHKPAVVREKGQIF